MIIDTKCLQKIKKEHFLNIRIRMNSGEVRAWCQQLYAPVPSGEIQISRFCIRSRSDIGVSS